jgi:cytochrome c556
MFRMSLAVSLLGALAIAGLTARSTAASAQSLSPEQIIAARQASYDMSVATINEMKLAVAAGQDVKKQFYPARALERWSKVLPTMFPAGTEPGATSAETHALPVVWTDRAGFEKAAADYQAATSKLSNLAQAGDSAGFSTQLSDLSKACDACHDKYKAK